jgi:hypothetical protein
MKSVITRSVTIVTVTIVTVAMLAAACGGATKTPVSPGPAAVFPVTIARSGGIAGFQDVVVVTSSGLVSITRKGQVPRRCQLRPATLGLLRTAASQVPWSRITPTRTNPSFPDDMVTTVQSPAGGPVRLEDLRAGTGGPVLRELLDDLLSGPATSQRCTPR